MTITFASIPSIPRRGRGGRRRGRAACATRHISVGSAPIHTEWVCSLLGTVGTAVSAARQADISLVGRMSDSEDEDVESTALLGTRTADNSSQQRIQWELILPIGACVLIFWVVAPSISLYNKWTFSYFGFHFPITFIIGTFSMNWLMAALLRLGLGHGLCSQRCTETGAGGGGPAQWAAEREKARPPPSRLFLIGVCTAFEIAASNLSLLTLTVSFHTMVKSSTPLFVAVFSVALGLEAPSMQLCGVVSTVTAGVMLCSYGEVDFDWLGFLYVLSAAMAGGFRWSLSQLLLQPRQVEQAPIRMRTPGSSSSSRLDAAAALGGGSSGGNKLVIGGLQCGELTLSREWSAMGGRLRLILVRATELLYHQLPISVLALFPVWLVLERTLVLRYFAAHHVLGSTFGLELLLVISGCALLAFILIVTELTLVALTYPPISTPFHLEWRRYRCVD